MILKLLKEKNTDALLSKLDDCGKKNKKLENQIEMIKLEYEKNITDIKIETTKKMLEHTKKQQNLQDSLDTCQNEQNKICSGTIVAENGLNLLKKQSEIEVCQDYGIYKKIENSALVFHPSFDIERGGAFITKGTFPWPEGIDPEEIWNKYS